MSGFGTVRKCQIMQQRYFIVYSYWDIKICMLGNSLFSVNSMLALG
jgi:hypothetical protein